MRPRVAFFAVLMALLPVGAMAQSACPDSFAGGQEPVLVNPKLAAKARAICYLAYGVLHSGVTRTPLWSAEHLTRDRVADAKETKRENAFHPEERLPADERSELADYARTGFDRGHMSPSGDMPDRKSQYESFTLANMIPQNPSNNRGLWAGIELAVRGLSTQDGDVYVVTGPIFDGAELERLNGRVIVPTHIFKAVYDVRARRFAVYLVANVTGSEYETITLAALEKMTGIRVFPAMAAGTMYDPDLLPAPTERHFNENGHANHGRVGGAGSAFKILKQLMR
jgi:endonuclease G